MQQKSISNIVVPVALSAIAAIGLTSCKPQSNAVGHSHGHGHGHSHGHGHAESEDEAARFTRTVCTNGFEVFVDHAAPVAGQSAEFVTHITELATGLPRLGGGIKLLLTDSVGAAFEHPQGAPAQAGIYLPKITFPKAGKWEVAVRIPQTGGAAMVPLGQVMVFADGHAAEEAHPEGPADGIAFSKEQQWNYPIRIQALGRRDMVEAMTVPGEVHLPAGSRGAVVTPIAGRFLAPVDGARPSLGQRLQRDEVIGRIQPVFSDISSRLVEVKAAVERAKIQLGDARRTFDRVAMLAESGAKSARELQTAEKAFRLAESELASARSLEKAYVAANSEYLRAEGDESIAVALSSPVDGVVTELATIATGEFVPEATTILRTVDATTVQINAFVPASRGSRLGAISGADVILPGRPSDWLPVLTSDRGRLVAVGKEVDEEKRTIPVYIATPNLNDRYRVGQQLTVKLHLGRRKNALVVPVSALIEESGLKTIYVQTGGETFAKRVVKTGLRDSEWVEVTDGVAEGEWVVVENAYAVRLAAVSGSALPHAHH